MPTCCAPHTLVVSGLVLPQCGGVAHVGDLRGGLMEGVRGLWGRGVWVEIFREGGRVRDGDQR